MLVCISDDESSDDDTAPKKAKDKDKKFQWNHGGTYNKSFIGISFFSHEHKHICQQLKNTIVSAQIFFESFTYFQLPHP